jgi:4-amino-4-deoxy-L-arabinose transferase-like glycosyltransferase
VNEPTAPATNSNAIGTAARIGWALLILATLYVCYFSHLGAIGFVGPDEPRYAWIARDMAETGDWVTPRLYGKPWFEKPILYYWSAALCFKLFGVSEAAARLPSAISALLASLALAWLALRIYGPETARWLLLLLPTTVGMIGFSHAAATDMPFSAMLTIAMVFAAVILRLIPNTKLSASPNTENSASPSSTSFTSSTSFASFLFGLFLGLAVLAKGPAALILSGGAVFFWALFTKRWRDAFRLLHPIAIATFCLTALPWYILCARRNSDFFRIFIIEHNFKRYLTPEFQHIQPFWYYGPILLLAFFPWIALLLWSLFTGAQHLLKTKSTNPVTIFLLTWSAFCIFFFSTSHSKLPGYILPAIPPVGLLLSHFCYSIGLAHRKAIGVTLLSFAGLALIGAALFSRTHIHAIRDFEMLKFAFLAVLGLTFVTNGLLGWAFLGKNDPLPRNSLMAFSSLPVVVILLFAGNTLGAMNQAWNSPKSVANQIQLHTIPQEKLFMLAYSNRGWRYSLNFYLQSEIGDWNRDSNAEAYLISGGRHCRNWEIATLSCSEISLGPDAQGWWILHVTPKSSTSQPSP